MVTWSEPQHLRFAATVTPRHRKDAFSYNEQRMQYGPGFNQCFTSLVGCSLQLRCYRGALLWRQSREERHEIEDAVWTRLFDIRRLFTASLICPVLGRRQVGAGRGNVPKDEIEQFILRLCLGPTFFDEECEFVSRVSGVDRDDTNARARDG